MAKIEKSQYKKIKKMYTEGNTMSDIAKYFKVPLDAIVYAMRKAKIPRRSMSMVQKIRFIKKPASFQIRKINNEKSKKILIAGLMLYWAEGYKTSKSSGVDFANSDSDMIITFMKFLRTCYKLDEKRLHVLLYCYNDQSISELMQFWSKKTGIPSEQFSKPYVREKINTNSRQMKYGLVHIRYSDKKLIFDILKRINILKKELCVGGGVV